jgi:hypothetical protein
MELINVTKIIDAAIFFPLTKRKIEQHDKQPFERNQSNTAQTKFNPSR